MSALPGSEQIPRRREMTRCAVSRNFYRLSGLGLTALERGHPGFPGRFGHATIIPRSQPVAPLNTRFRELNFGPAVSGIFFAVGRRHMRRISIQIRSPDSKLVAVCIDPFPQAFGESPPLRSCRAFDAHDIGGKPVAIAAAEAPAMV